MQIVIAIFWIACGVAAYGATFGHFQNKFPSLAKRSRSGDMLHAVVGGFLGPVGLFSIAIVSGGFKYGFKWK